MILYRSSTPKRRLSLSFLTSQGQHTALLAQLDKNSWIDEIFKRPLPIPHDFQTRFGPPGFAHNVFYASERRETTFFEFGYNLLKARSVLGRGIRAVCFEVTFHPKLRPIEISAAENVKELLNPQSYAAAQRWILQQNLVPESLRYPSLRDPEQSGINFAIYKRSALKATLLDPEELILTPQANGTLDLASLTRGQLPSIKPIFY